MASIISELRSVTFQSQSTTVFVSELNIQKHNIMAPQQQDTLPKSSDFEVEQRQKASPVSNLGTSLESGSPASNGETAETMKSNKDEKMEDISSDDSGSVQNYHINENEYPSPLMRLQSALRKDGKLGKKLNLSSPIPKTPSTSSWIPTANGMLERNLPTSSSGTVDKIFSTAVVIPNNNLSSATSDIYSNNVTPTGLYTNPSPTSSANCNNNVQPMSNGLFHGRSPTLIPRSYHDGLSHNAPGQFNENNVLLCRICDFTCILPEDLESHMDNHYIYKCPRCNYRSKTEGRLTRHVNEFHSETPPDNWTGTRASKAKLSNSEQLLDNSVSSSNNKTRSFRCKHCSFVAYMKSDFWKHVRTHIKPDKLLECDQCEFVTEFKHHYEYHISNHAGRKPFKCSMCNYKCVNKSMLNSHLKSHSNVYQFHCADCKYETKYCHSIKQHLKKHNHKPGVVLNQDGTPCPFQVIDVYGRRRGPRTKKRKLEMSDENCLALSVPSATQLHAVPQTSQHSLPFSTSIPMLQPNIPAVYPHFFGDYSQNLMMRNNPKMRNSSFSLPMSITGRNPVSCNKCNFIAHDTDILQRHMIQHAAAENQDLAKLYLINSEFYNDRQFPLSNDMNGQKIGAEHEDNEKKLFPSEYERQLEYQGDIRSYKQEHEVDENIKSEDGSSSKCRRTSSPAVEENDSFRGYSTPSPQYSSSHSPDFILYEKKDEMSQRMSPTFVLHENRMHVDESPIDLSGRKSSDSIHTNKITGASDTQSSEFNTLTSTMESSNVSSSSQRNRRKGKAYRINHYVQYDEQSSPQEFVKGSGKHNPLDMSKTEDEVKQSDKEQNLLKTPITSLDKQQNIEVPALVVVDDNANLRQENKTKSNSSSERLASSPVAINVNCLNSSNSQPVKRIESSNDRSSLEPMMKSEKTDSKNVKTDSFVRRDTYECNHCGIAFKNSAMYSVHMGYHGYMNPFTCNLCGHVTDNAVEFFVHIARVPHP